MHDPNIEHTVPSKPDASDEETRANPVVPESDAAPALEPTQVHVVDRTAAAPALEQTAATPAAVDKPSRSRRWPWFLLGIVLILAFGAFGVWQGYQSAARLRTARQAEANITNATEHFMLGIQAQENKQYSIARQQFEYVIQIDPNFPGAQDRLREVMIQMAIVETPTPAPTVAEPTLTPTLDTRPQEEIYATARQQYAAQDWEGVFASVDSLRRIDPTYRAVEIDGMLYLAYRFRGVDKLIHTVNLEAGLYDLALAERFGPLDVDALGYRNWARQYLTGASFWMVDWLKVVQYFEEIYPYFPNMRDSSGLTAVERYRVAARSYADQLNTAGDYCTAYEYYEKSLQAAPDGEVELKATEVYTLCYVPTATETLTPTPTLTLTVGVVPTLETPVVVPTVEVTATSETPVEPLPTETPSPEPTAATP